MMMLQTSLLILLIASSSTAFIVFPLEDPLITNLKKIPESDRESFLLYVLAMGVAQPEGKTLKLRLNDVLGKGIEIPKGLEISQDLLDDYQAMNIPEASFKRYLHWVQTEFNLTETEVVEIMLQVVDRLPHNGLDVNELCCPW